MQKKHLVALNPSTGQARANATVTVYNAGTTTLASIYADDETTPLANPLTTDTSGRTSFKAGNGDYDITVSGEGFNSYTIDQVQFAEVDDFLTGDFETGLPNHTHESPTQGGTIRALRAADASLLLLGVWTENQLLKRVTGNVMEGYTPIMPVIRAYTTAGSPHTWTKPAASTGFLGIKILVVGGGGGGAGIYNTFGTQNAFGGGGGPGAGAIHWIAAASLGATETITIGAAGAGGSAGETTLGIPPTAGATGGTTSFGAHVTCPGGSGGPAGYYLDISAGYGAGPMVKNGVPGTPVGGSLHAWGVSVLSCWPTTLVGSSIDTFNETPGPFGLYQGRGGPAQRNGINTVSNPGYAGQAGVVLLQEYYA